MSELLAEIKAKQINARKARLSTATLLTTLIGEAEMVGKNQGREVTDSEVLAMIKKFIKNIDETLKVLVQTDMRIPSLIIEKNTLESFLPKQLTEEELQHVLGSIKVEISAGPKDMGKMLGLLKTRFDGQYDGKVASAVAKSLLS